MSLPILTLTIAVMYGVHIAVTPPVVARSSQRTFSAENPYFSLLCLRILDIASCIISSIEILLLATSSLAVHFPQSAVIIHIHDSLSTKLLISPGHAITVSPIRCTAGIAIITGSVIRGWCYREMGRQYTFRVSVLKNHTLVTMGPYNVVRHPGYTGGILLLVALPFWYASQGGWIYGTELSDGNRSTLRAMVGASFAVLGAPVAWVSARRAAEEDALMRREFGKTWEDWARKTPYKFIPGIL